MKPTRIDEEKIKWGGEFARKMFSLAQTGHTQTEDHTTCDWWFIYREGEPAWNVEQKTVRRCFNYDRNLYPSTNENWDLDTFSCDVPTGRTWMLNWTNTDGTPGKFQHMGDRDCLQYIFKDGVLIFSPKALKRAFLGTAMYKCSKRQEFEREKRKPMWQCRAVINLEEGTWIPCTPPEEFFESNLHEDFNKQNK